VLIAAAWSVYVVQVESLNERAAADALQRAGQLARSYQGDASATIGYVDNLLRFMAAYEAQNGVARTAALVAQERLYAGVFGNVAIVDARGAGFAVGPMGRVPILLADSANVRAANRTTALVVGPPLTARVTKHFAIPFVRSVRRSDGTLAGDITAVVDVRAFAFGYGANDLGPHGVLELVGTADRVVRERVAGNADAALVGRRLSPATPMWRQLASVPDGSYRLVSRLDGLLRLFAYRRVPGFPLVALAGLAEPDIAAGTAPLRHTMLLAAWGATAVVLALLLLWLHQQRIRQQLRALQKSALAASQAKSDFLASMSHEIRTPMNGVIGLTHLALESDEPAVQRDYLEKIDYSAKSLLGIINDILDFSKIEAGKLEIEAVPFDLRAVVENIAATAEINARHKGLRLEVRIDAETPKLVEGDPVRYGQIVLNLLTNAVKFTHAGSVVLSVRTARLADDRVEVTTAVTDTGIGISAADRARLFQSFSQADSSISRRFGGTGLGLAICKALVERMGGSIGVESEPGAGSTFAFTIPFTQLAERRSGDRTAPVAAGEDRLAGRRVLVADDNAINRHIVERLLARLGIETESVEDGRRAVDAVLAAPQSFDLVLMDVEMPELDGLAATRLIRERIPAEALPIVAMTAHAMEQERRLCLEAGMNDRVTKPIDPKEFAQTLRRWIREPQRTS
jgi:signal transduction histidine kinase/ActR/RegA family two-component response regulator